MTTYVIRNGELVEKNFSAPNDFTHSAPNFIRDTMNDTWHPATGRIFNSKSRFREETKAAGCQEIGTVSKVFGKRAFVPKLDGRQRVQDIQKAIYQLRNGKR